MVKVKFVGMLVGILFLMNVLRDYYAVAHQDHFLGIQHSHVGRNHDISYPMVAATDTDQLTPLKNHTELGGRKMVVMKKKNKVGQGASSVVGDDHPIKSASLQVDDEDDHNMETVAYHKKMRYLKQAFPAAASIRVKRLKVAAATATKGDGDQRLLEATRKMVALMHRDYKGMNKPKRKPPINNNLPVH